MLVAGGVLDQPAGRWMARDRAASLWRFLEKYESSGADYNTMTKPELEQWNRAQAVQVDMTEPRKRRSG